MTLVNPSPRKQRLNKDNLPVACNEVIKAKVSEYFCKNESQLSFNFLNWLIAWNFKLKNFQSVWTRRLWVIFGIYRIAIFFWMLFEGFKEQSSF